MKTAVIGLGPHGHRVLDVIKQMPELTLTAVVDKRQNALASKAVPPDVARYRSAEKLWHRGDIELVCVATNAPSHAELAIAAMEAGVRFVMVEKPMACSIDECARMVAKAKETGTRLAVDHPQRYTPVYRWLRQMIQSGKWGELRSFWIQRPGIGLGCLATHSFDLVRFLSGAEVQRVTAWVDEPIKKNPRGEEFIDPGGLVILEMDGGWRAVVAQLEDGAGPISLEINLTAARVRFDEKSRLLEVIERDLSVNRSPTRQAAYRFVEIPSSLLGKRDLRTEIRRLLEELISDGPIEADGVDGLASIEILIAAYLSHQRGHIPLLLPCRSAEERNLWVPVT